MELSIVMPVYNEGEIIGKVIKNWIKALNQLGIEFEIHAYNDGSKDNSLNVLKQVAEEEDKLIVHDKVNSGHGPTILQGYRENSDSNWIFQSDSDDEIGPEEFERLWRDRQSYDFVIGRRVRSRQPLARKVMSMGSRMIVRCFYGSRVYDVNSPFRLMRSKAFKDLFPLLPENMFAPNVAVSGLVSLFHLRAKEIPVRQRERTTGEVSIKKLRLIKAALRSFLETITCRFRLMGGDFKRTPFNI